MSRQVAWSLMAKEDYAALLQYLDSNFGTDSALKMMDKVEEVVTRLTEFPEVYPASTLRPEVRKAVITPQTSLFYRLLDTQIQLLHLWDNRQNPGKLSEIFEGF